MSHAPLYVQWLAAFALTQALEIPIYVRAFRVRFWVAFGASAITHPVVWFVIPALWTHTCARWFGGCPRWHGLDTWYYGYGLVAESFAIGVEAVWFAIFRVRRPLIVSLVGNAVSALVGMVLTLTIGWP